MSSDTIPLFTCDPWCTEYGNDFPGFAIIMCISEKLIILIGFITWLYIIYQMYIYIKIYSISPGDRRLIILLICWLSALFTWFRYSFFNTEEKGFTFFFVEIFRFIIFYTVCYYYCSKASDLLPNYH